ncbi:MAG: 50S ribosomal protein L6 [Nitrospinota bacterium]|nr:50S ribosomal protein L6 [Nitrospinota bacterium]MDH5678067.1 50S ribosomal protein L6 [Nitrospinota bacterium]MDH5755547.1 50S ribosomal protein L6 [Nitrospinota bacterium]
MSRVGKQPVAIPAGVEVKIDGSKVAVKGKLGRLEQSFDPRITVEIKDGSVVVTRPDDSGQSRALHGLTRALINNMTLGVSAGFSKTLLIEGVGYQVNQKGKSLEFSLGYTHTITVDPPEGITLTAPKKTEVLVSGPDKHMVGQVAANIRKLRKPEPYKGKGVRYSTERIRRKAGKTATK